MLPGLYRIRHQAEFERFFHSKEVKKTQSSFVTLYVARSKEIRPRFGFVVSTKVSKKATVRNRIKRRMRAVIASMLHGVKGGVIAVLVARPGADRAAFKEVDQTIKDLLGRARLLSPPDSI